LLQDWAEVRLPGAYAALAPALRLLARSAVSAGVERALRRRYLAL
jgi:hypothetical protein